MNRVEYTLSFNQNIDYNNTRNNLSRAIGYLLDYTRTNTYNEFIKENMRDKIVVDCGAGSGILSWLSIKHGAKKVYSIERDNETVQFLKDISSNYANWEILQLDLFADNLPVADIYIHEIIGDALINEGILDFVANCRRQKIEHKIYPNNAKIFKVEPKYIDRVFDIYSMDNLHSDIIEFCNEIDIHQSKYLTSGWNRSWDFELLSKELLWDGNIFTDKFDLVLHNDDYITWEMTFDHDFAVTPLVKDFNNWYPFVPILTIEEFKDFIIS